MQQIDWPGIQANSVHMGIRGAARAASAGLSAPEQKRFVDRVMQRAYREGWEEKRLAIIEAHQSKPAAGGAKKSLSANVSTGAEAAAFTQADHSRRSRSAGLEYAAHVTEFAARKAKSNPGIALELAPLVKSSLQGAAIAGDWQADRSTSVRIDIYAGGVERQVEGRVIEQE